MKLLCIVNRSTRLIGLGINKIAFVYLEQFSKFEIQWGSPNSNCYNNNIDLLESYFQCPSEHLMIILADFEQNGPCPNRYSFGI